MELNFFSGKGFNIEEMKNKIYLYSHTGKIHIYGELSELLIKYDDPMIHIFNERSVPNIIYFTPVLLKDQINKMPKSKEAVKIVFHLSDYNHCSGSCTKLFKDMNICPGPPKQKNSKSSGYYINYKMETFLNRSCAIINLNDIENWKLTQ